MNSTFCMCENCNCLFSRQICTVLQLFIFFFSVSIVLVKFEASQYRTKVGLWNQYPLCWRPDSGIIIIYILCALSGNRTYSSMLIVRVAERLALPTSDHGVTGSNPAGGEILPEPKRRFIAQSLSCSPFLRLEMTEILLKGRKTLTHPSIYAYIS